jgi:PAS domain S-box-containing protein
MTFLTRFFALPHFPTEPEKTRHAQLLHVVSLVLLFTFVSLVLVNLLLDTRFGQTVNAVLLGLALLQLVTQILVRRGSVRAAGYLLLLLSWASITWIASMFDGVRSVVLFAYFTIILSAGYIFSWRTVMLLTMLSILGVWTLALNESAGISTPVMDTPVSIAINLTALFIFASIQIYFIISVLKKSLREKDRELNERLRMEQVVRSEQDRLALALDASKMGTWEWNIETGAVSWSEKIEAMFGMAPGGFDGHYETYMSLIHPDDLADVQQAIAHALDDANYHYIIEHRLYRKTGELRWLEGRGTVYRNPDGHPVRMAGTVVDITERKTNEAERERLIRELADKNAELEQFTYTVSHDLKAPIVTIKGFLGFLEQDALDGNHERLKRDLGRISGAVDKMHSLLNELLELSRIGRMMNPPEPIQGNTLVNEAVELLQGRLSETTRFRLVVAPNLPTLHGDRRRLLEVFQNLLDNALKFSSSSGAPVIEVGVHGYEQAMPILFVRDNGIGIAPEHYERIFGLFNKLDPLAEGTGVGLTLVRRIIEVHGGRIWVESVPGQGAVFYFTLPAQPVPVS